MKNLMITCATVASLMLGQTPSLAQVNAAVAPSSATAESVVETRSTIMLASETFDGTTTKSVSQRAGVFRASRGDQTWTKVDFGDGAIVERTGDVLSTGRFASTSDVELGILYNQRWQVMTGDDWVSSFFNERARPIIEQGPAPTSDGAWQVAFSRTDIGLRGGAITMNFTKKRLDHDGKVFTLVTYDMPAFSYRGERGANVVQWGRGAALFDAVTNQTIWRSAHHRAVRQAGSEVGRPYRYSTSSFALGEGDRPLFDLTKIDAIKPILESLTGGEASADLPSVETEEEVVDQVPLRLASFLDLAGLTLSQNGMNGETLALTGFVLGRTGENTIVNSQTAAAGEAK
jgi:hypothetical protein